MRLQLVPPALKEDWNTLLKNLGLSATKSLVPRGPFHPSKVCEYDVCPQIVITVMDRWGDLYAALLSLRTYSKVAVVLTDRRIRIPSDLINDFPAVSWLHTPKQLHLSSAWNVAIETFLSESHFVICNEDIMYL